MNKILTPSNYEVIPLDARTNVRFYTSDYPANYVPPHWHDAIEIIYLLEGSVKVITEGNVKELQARQCTLIQANQIHSTLCTRPNRSIILQIPQAFLEKFVPDASERTFLIEDPPSSEFPDESAANQKKLQLFKQTLKNMMLIQESTPDGAVLLFNGLLFQGLYQLYHDFSTPVSDPELSRRSQKLQRLTPVLEYINNNYKRSLSLTEVAAVASFDPKYFCRFFKKYMGTTFLEYQNEIRISRIYQDLISTDDKISDILERHGFTNYKLFRRMFREHFGASPSDIRRI